MQNAVQQQTNLMDKTQRELTKAIQKLDYMKDNPCQNPRHINAILIAIQDDILNAEDTLQENAVLFASYVDENQNNQAHNTPPH